MLDCGTYHAQGNLEGAEKGWGGGRNILWVRDSFIDGGSVSVRYLAVPNSDGQLFEDPVLKVSGGGSTH